MKKKISFLKLSKKKKKEQNAKRRGTWYGLNPVTRKPENSGAYDRKKENREAEKQIRDCE